MKSNILKITVMLLSMTAALIFLTDHRVACASRAQDGPTMTEPDEKPVELVFKNIKVLNGMPQSQLYPTMRFMAASLGFQCGSCHVIRNGMIDAALDDKPEKQTARQMIKMVIDLNRNLGRGEAVVSCYTCHRGQRSPQGTPVLPLPTAGTRTPTTTGLTSTLSLPALPAGDEILDKYFVAIGGKAKADQVKSCFVKGTTTTATGQTVAYESETAAPDKGHESFAIQEISGRSCAGDSRCEYERVINGQQGWLKSGAGVQELVGRQLGDQKLSFPLFSILKLKEQYSSFRIYGREKIGDHDVYVLSATRTDDKPERLYFDVDTGLLRRRISYLRTVIATIPQQTDYEDYRDVDGLKLPFKIIMSFADPGSRPIIREFAEIKLNVPIPESKFEKPR